MLVERLERDDVPVWLVNTGWTGGPYGTGRADEHRPHPVDGPGGARRARSTRVPTRIDPNFGVAVPTQLPGRAGVVPRPARDVGRSRRPTTAAAAELAAMFRDNFAGYADGVERRRSPRPAPATGAADGVGRRCDAVRSIGRPRWAAAAPARSSTIDADHERREAERKRDREEDEEEPEEGERRAYERHRRGLRGRG